MAEPTTLTSPSEGGTTDDAPSARRRIRRARSLPGGRAVVGALLVAGAAVGVFGAYLNATAEPDTLYLVADRSIEPGTRFASFDEVLESVTSVAVELHPEVASRAIPVEEAEQLVGAVLISPFQPGDLLNRTAVVRDGGVSDAQTLSFSLPASDAVAGTLRAGERIDVLATYGQGDGEYTAYVVRGVPIIRITGGASASGPVPGAAEDVTLTVAVTSLIDVQALGHAVNTAAVFVTRSTATPDDDAAPGAYRPEFSEDGPEPDPADTPVGTADGPEQPGVDLDGDGIPDEPDDEEGADEDADDEPADEDPDGDGDGDGDGDEDDG